MFYTHVSVKAVPKPNRDRVAVAPVYSKFSDYPSHGLTPQRLAAIFREADEGEVFRQMELFEEMEEHDPHLYAQLQTRKNAVTGLDWEISPYGDTPLDMRVAAFVEEQLRAIPKLEEVFQNLLDAIGKGLSVVEILWANSGGSWVAADLVHIQPKLLRWDTEDVLRIVTQDQPLGIPPPPNKFIFHVYHAKSGHPSRAGILRVCAWMYLFKNYALKDWAAFIEVFGLPLRLGKYAAGASEEDKEALWRALVQMGTDAAGMVPDGTSIDFISTDASKGSGGGLYETMARYCDEQISKAVLGQTLTADSGGGSFAQSKTHNDVRHDLTVADCKALAATLRDGLIRPLVLFNFGWEAAERLPTLSFDCELPEDLQSLATILSTLSGMSVPIPLPYIYKKFGIPDPKPGESTTLDGTQNRLVPHKADPAQISPDYQRMADEIAAAGTAQSLPLFAKMADPLQAFVKNGGSLEELRDALNDPKTAGTLFDSCVSDELTRAIENGVSMGEFKTSMDDFLQRNGCSKLHPLQAENIFRTNVQTAYNVGAYEEMTDPAVLKSRPYWRYDAVEDGKTRPSHRAMNGKVFPADSPVWDTWYPPNGFKCRCGVSSLSRRQVEAQGLTVETQLPDRISNGMDMIPMVPDKDFNYNPAKVKFSPDLSELPTAVQAAYQRREESRRVVSPE